MLNNDLLALIITFVLAVTWLRTNDFAAHRGWIDSQLSRKIIHMGTGPLFVMCWPLFSEATSARYLAAGVPLLITLQFILVGLGVIKDDAAVKAMSRTGNRREILRGPLFYGIIFVLVTIFFWTESPTGIVALMLMCGGDGLADILGRRFDKARLPWSTRKSWVGSAGMLAGGWLFSILIIAYFTQLGFFPAPFSQYVFPITVIAVAGTLVESLPVHDIDNITVTLVAIGLGHLLF